jgi:hypothetical protein
LNNIIAKNNALPYKRYLIIPTEKYKEKADINDLLQNTYNLIKKDDYDSLSSQLSKYKDKNNGCYKYAKALSSQFQAKYSDALDIIQYIDFVDCSCHAYLLRADLYMETSQSKQFKSLLEPYQKAIDCDDENDWKLLLKTRIKLLRYEK